MPVARIPPRDSHNHAVCNRLRSRHCPGAATNTAERESVLCRGPTPSIHDLITNDKSARYDRSYAWQSWRSSTHDAYRARWRHPIRKDFWKSPANHVVLSVISDYLGGVERHIDDCGGRQDSLHGPSHRRILRGWSSFPVDAEIRRYATCHCVDVGVIRLVERDCRLGCGR